MGTSNRSRPARAASRRRWSGGASAGSIGAAKTDTLKPLVADRLRLQPRVRRLLRPASFGPIARRVVDELAAQARARRMERLVSGWRQHSQPIAVGPCLTEVGFEVLYWIPYVRALLRRHEVPRDRVIAVSRGGVGSWYEDFADRYVDAVDVCGVARYLAGLEERRARVGDQKQHTVESFDQRILRLVEPSGTMAVLHPSAMFTRLRWLWADGSRLDSTVRQLDHIVSLSEPLEGLPSRYVAVKPYFNEQFPLTAENREAVSVLIDTLSQEEPVVVLVSGPMADGHDEYLPESTTGVTVVSGDPNVNLGLQARAIAGASRFYCPYGGFSYVALLAGVPTSAFLSQPPSNPVHMDVARMVAARLGVPYSANEVAALLATGATAADQECMSFRT